MGKDSKAQRMRKYASIMFIECLIVFNTAIPLLGKREQDRRKRLAVKDKRTCEGGKWGGMMELQVPLESSRQNVIRRPEVFLILPCNRTSIKSIVTMFFPLCLLYHRPAD